MVSVNGIYRFSVIGSVQGQQHIHTLHFRSTTDPDGLLMTEEAWQTALVTQWQTSNRTAYRALFGTVDRPNETYSVRKVCGSSPLPAGVDVAEAGGSTAGTRVTTGDPLAPWLATVTTIRTGLAGRRYRGRSFIGGMYEADVVGASVQGGLLTLLDAYFSGLRTTFATPADVDLPFKWFVFSRVQAGVVGTQCQDAGANVTNYQLRGQLATMKSRKAGSGI